MTVRKKLLTTAVAIAALTNFACSKQDEVNAEKARFEKESQLAIAQAKTLEEESKKALEAAKQAEKKASEAEAASNSLKAKLEATKIKQDADNQAALDVIENERAALIAEKTQLEETRKTVEAEIASKKSDLAALETSVAALEKATADTTKLNAAQTADAVAKLDAAKSDMEKARISKEEAEARLTEVAKREVVAGAREERVNAASVAWKDLFAQYKMTDIFDKILANEDQLLFQVSLVGYGSRDVIEKARAQITGANQDPTLANAKKIGPFNMGRNTTVAKSVYDSFLIKSVPKRLKAAQDQIILASDSDKANNTLLFVVVRVVENPIVTTSMKVTARNDLKGKSVSTVMNLKLGSRPITGVDLTKVNLDQPAQYFLGDTAKNVCVTISADCLKAMVDTKNLSNEFEIETMDSEYNEKKEKASAQQLLRQSMYLSTRQLIKDLTTANGEQLFGIQRKITDQGEIEREFHLVDGWFGKLIGTENRYPIIQEVVLTYSIAMQVQTPRSGMLPLDTIYGTQKNSFHGFNLSSVDQVKRTYEFALPLAVVQGSKFNFPAEAKSAIEAAKKDKLSAPKDLTADKKAESEYVQTIGETLGFQQEMVRKLK